MKYVAFVDTLGFTQRINSISHEEAVDVIRKFNQSVYNLWREMGLDKDDRINGRTFSDSFIIHSIGDSNEDLKKILDFLIRLYKISIAESYLPLRGGIALGDFDDIRATEFNNLQKGLIIGTAFIDAYLLESNNGIKGSKLLFSEEINLLIENVFIDLETKKVKITKDGKTIYELKRGNLRYLTERNFEALNKFIEFRSEIKMA